MQYLYTKAQYSVLLNEIIMAYILFQKQGKIASKIDCIQWDELLKSNFCKKI
jgi:hypothetical protein